MEYKFKIKNYRLLPLGCFMGTTGNANSCVCRFDIDCDYPELDWFCTFENGGSYAVPIVNGECVIPYEVLVNSGTLRIGVYGTDENPEGPCRISTNLINVAVEQGAYNTESAEAMTPEADSWELFVNSRINPKLEEIDGREAARQSAELAREAAEVQRRIDSRNAVASAGNAADGALLAADSAALQGAEAQAAAENANIAADNANAAAAAVGPFLDAVGDIDTALDTILAIQDELIGGDAE